MSLKKFVKSEPARLFTPTPLHSSLCRTFTFRLRSTPLSIVTFGQSAADQAESGVANELDPLSVSEVRSNLRAIVKCAGIRARSCKFKSRSQWSFITEPQVKLCNIPERGQDHRTRHLSATINVLGDSNRESFHSCPLVWSSVFDHTFPMDSKWFTISPFSVLVEMRVSDFALYYTVCLKTRLTFAHRDRSIPPSIVALGYGVPDQAESRVANKLDPLSVSEVGSNLRAIVWSSRVRAGSCKTISQWLMAFIREQVKL